MGGGQREVPPTSEVAPGVHRVQLGRALTDVCVYLVESGGSWVLVDTGWAHHAPAVRTAAEARFGAGTRPAAIVLTHVHPDHSGAAPELVRAWDVPVHLHPDELPFARGGYDPEHAHPLDRWLVAPLLRLLPADRVEAARARSSLEHVAVAYDPDAAVPGLPGWRCVPTPGHTPGHAAYFRPTDRVLLSGDALLTVDTNSPIDLLAGRPGTYGPPRVTTWDWPLARRSLDRLLALAPAVVASGHGPPLYPSPEQPMSAVVSTVTIGRPADVVFDYLTDLTREPEWNEQMRDVVALDAGPVRPGSRYQVHFGRGVGAALIEYLDVDRPARWRTRSTSARLDVDFTGAVVPLAGGCHVRLVTVLRPHGPLRVAAPVLRRVMADSWRRHLATVKDLLEAEPPPSPAAPAPSPPPAGA